jgi:hypothetical protein
MTAEATPTVAAASPPLAGTKPSLNSILRFPSRVAFAIALAWACNQTIGWFFVSPAATTSAAVRRFEQDVNAQEGVTGVKVCLSKLSGNDAPGVQTDEFDSFCRSQLPSLNYGLSFLIGKKLEFSKLPNDPANPNCPKISNYRVECGSFYRYVQIWPLPIWSPEIVDSIHSFVRKIELLAFHSGSEPAELKLCTGTPHLLSPKYCHTTSAIEKGFSENGLDNLIDSWVRFGAMLSGVVQLLTWVLFWLIALQLIAVARLVLGPRTSLFSLDMTGGVSLRQLPELNFRTAYDKYRSLAARSIGDMLWVSYIPFEAAVASSAQNRKGDLESLDRERTRLRQLAEDSVSSFEKYCENILKLSFAGTIIGIGQSLFNARDLDTADPINKILVKSKMFAGIGTAFGNTLVGIGLSMVALFIVELFVARWLEAIEFNTDIIRDFALSGNPLLSPPVPPPRLIEASTKDAPASTFEKIGALAVICFVGWVFYTHRSVLIAYSMEILNWILTTGRALMS